MIKAGIFGISGYAGQKLVEILTTHPEVELTAGFVSSRRETTELTKLMPKFQKIFSLKCENNPDWKKIEEVCDVLFLALPHSLSMERVPPLAEMQKKIIDLSADFRFNNLAIYEKWYVKHTCPELNEKFLYGLPEINRDKIKNADFIANPGCYPTSVILAMLPLTKNDIISKDIIADSKSGVTGAGRAPSLDILFAECNENIKAYKIGEHRHSPEMEEVLNGTGGKEYSVTFVPHLAPFNQGILSTCYAKLNNNYTAEELQNLYEEVYAEEPFVRIMDYGVSPEIKNVINTNFCDIGIKKTNEETLVVISAIDNLVKGAAGQAVQNMNLIFGFEETIPFYR